MFRLSLLTISQRAGLCQLGASEIHCQSKFVLSSPDASSLRKFPKPIPRTFSDAPEEICRPRLQWTGAPAGTKSFVLTLFDPDEHGDPSGWWHWIVYNLPASHDKPPQGRRSEHSTALPSGTMQGAPTLVMTLITAPALTKEIRHTAIRSPFML